MFERASTLRKQLLAWYHAHRRDLPWRRTDDPYAIWVSEIMLQQTRVAVVIERYRNFLERFPTIAALANAREEDVLALWSGLGYYRRARMLHKASQQVVTQLAGNMPATSQELLALPGIGKYTAAAIASIAHGERVAVVDGNVERVLCRVAGWDGSSKSNASLRKKVEALAAHLVDLRHPGDFNQAMMELGATVCVPRSPQCLLCPIAAHCKTRGEHKTERRKPMRSVEIGHALAVRTRRQKSGAECQQVLLERRPASLSVMPGLWELPALRSSDVPESVLRMTVRHAIMQTNYTVRIRLVTEKEKACLADARGEHRWFSLQEIVALPLTGLTRKVLRGAHLWESK